MKTNISTLLMALVFAFQTHAQQLNQEIIEDGASPFLLGKIDKNGLQSKNYNHWFTKNYDDYQPNSDTV